MKRDFLKIAGFALVSSLIFTACDKDEENASLQFSNATLVVCEGNFEKNEGSIDAIVSGKVEQDIYSSINEAPLGDVVQSLTIINDKAYIVVYNSQKIEVADANTFKNIGTIKGFSYPRYVIEANENEIFVSNGNGYEDNYIYVVNTLSLEKTDSIAAGIGPNTMVASNGKLFIANMGGWSTANTVTVIDINTKKIEKNITVGDIPSDMEVDAEGNIIVLCKGANQYDENWNVIGSSNSTLVSINASSMDVTTIKEFDHQVNSYGSNLLAYNNGTIYYVDGGVYSIEGSTETKIIEENDIYGLSIDSKTNEIWITQAPYSSAHQVKQYNNAGELVSSYTVGNYPNDIIFR